MEQVVAPDLKALMRRLLVRHPVDRASFDEFFNSQALNNSKFSLLQDTVRGSGGRDTKDSTSSIPGVPEEAMPVAQRAAPPIPGMDARKANEQQLPASMPSEPSARARTKSSAPEKVRERVTPKEKGSKEERQRKVSPQQISLDPPQGERNGVATPAADEISPIPTEPKTIPSNKYVQPFIVW